MQGTEVGYKAGTIGCDDSKDFSVFEEDLEDLVDSRRGFLSSPGGSGYVLEQPGSGEVSMQASRLLLDKQNE